MMDNEVILGAEQHRLYDIFCIMCIVTNVLIQP